MNQSIGIGLCLGVVFGVAFDNLALGISLGLVPMLFLSCLGSVPVSIQVQLRFNSGSTLLGTVAVTAEKGKCFPCVLGFGRC